MYCWLSMLLLILCTLKTNKTDSTLKKKLIELQNIVVRNTRLHPCHHRDDASTYQLACSCSSLSTIYSSLSQLRQSYGVLYSIVEAYRNLLSLEMNGHASDRIHTCLVVQKILGVFLCPPKLGDTSHMHKLTCSLYQATFSWPGCKARAQRAWHPGYLAIY